MADYPFTEVDMFIGRSYYQCLTDVVNRQTASKIHTFFHARHSKSDILDYQAVRTFPYFHTQRDLAFYCKQISLLAFKYNVLIEIEL